MRPVAGAGGKVEGKVGVAFKVAVEGGEEDASGGGVGEGGGVDLGAADDEDAGYSTLDMASVFDGVVKRGDADRLVEGGKA